MIEPYLNHPRHCDPHAHHLLLAVNRHDCYMRGCVGILEWKHGANIGLLSWSQGRRYSSGRERCGLEHQEQGK